MLQYKLLQGTHVQAKKTYIAGVKGKDKLHSPVALDELFPGRFQLLGEIEDPKMKEKLKAFAEVNNKQYDKPAPEFPEEDKPKEPEVDEPVDAETVEAPAEALYAIEKNGAWYKVVNKETGVAVNEKSLRKAEAEDLLAKVNG